MTNRELIEALQRLNPDREIALMAEVQIGYLELVPPQFDQVEIAIRFSPDSLVNPIELVPVCERVIVRRPAE